MNRSNYTCGRNWLPENFFGDTIRSDETLLKIFRECMTTGRYIDDLMTESEHNRLCAYIKFNGDKLRGEQNPFHRFLNHFDITCHD